MRTTCIVRALRESDVEVDTLTSRIGYPQRYCACLTPQHCDVEVGCIGYLHLHVLRLGIRHDVLHLRLWGESVASYDDWLSRGIGCSDIQDRWLQSVYLCGTLGVRIRNREAVLTPFQPFGRRVGDGQLQGPGIARLFGSVVWGDDLWTLVQ